jgi:AcrR family transcriptional regulator
MTLNSTSPLPGLRERSKRERRLRIEAAARDVFREKGFEAATTREIAARAGVGTGTLFVYARDKRALLRMVFRDALEYLTESAFATVPVAAPLIEQLVHVFSPRYAFWGDDPRLSRHAVTATFGARFEGDGDVSDVSPAVHALNDRLIELIARNQRAATVAADVRPELLARLILDVYYNENREWIADRDPGVEAGVARLREVLELALRSFTPEAS